jgi:hypothetical protein
MATVFMAAVLMAAVSVAEALVTGASEATDFGLLAFSEAFVSATMAAITPPLRIRALLSDRVRDDLLLLITAQAPRANLRIAMLH